MGVDDARAQRPVDQPRRGYAQPRDRPHVAHRARERVGHLDAAAARERGDGVLERDRDSLREEEREGCAEELVRGVDEQVAAAVQEARDGEADVELRVA